MRIVNRLPNRMILVWIKYACAVVLTVGFLHAANIISFRKTWSKQSVPKKKAWGHVLGPIHGTSVTKKTGGMENNITKVIVAAYYRGGSSFLAQLLNKNPNVFYYFEPFVSEITAYKHAYKLNRGDAYVDKSGNFRKLPADLEEWMSDAAIRLMTCDFDELPETMFYHDFLLSNSFVQGKHLQKYQECMLYKRRSTNQTKGEYRTLRNKDRKDKFPKCIPLLQKSCDAYKVRGFKEIRMTVEQLYRTLEKDPEVKVIYSTRDPRAMASSRHQNNLQYKDVAGLVPFETTAREMCVHMRYDLNRIAHLQERFPDNLFRTTYEQIVKNPLSIARKVYAFLNMQQNDNVNRWLVKSKSHNSHGNTTGKWRTLLTDGMQQSLRKHCTDVMNILGIPF